MTVANRAFPKYRNIHTLMMEFLCLYNHNDFFHLFEDNAQDINRYKGRMLEENFKPTDLAENIYTFLNANIEELQKQQKVATREVLIEKCGQRLSPSIWLFTQLNNRT